MAWTRRRKPKSKKIASRSLATAFLSLFAQCYVRGASDACDSYDDYTCGALVAKTMTPGVFGFVFKPRMGSYDSETWSAMQMVTELKGIMLYGKVKYGMMLFQYLSKMLKPTNYQMCALYVAQAFYNMGIRNFLDYHDRSQMAKIKSFTYPEWTKDGVIRLDRQKMLFRFQEVCNDCATLHEMAPNGTPGKVSRRKFDEFQRSIWAMLQDFDETWDEFFNY